MVPATPRKEAASAEVAAARALAITCAGLRPRKPSRASRVVATAVVTVEGEGVVIELADGELDLGGMAKRLPGLLLGGCPPPLPDAPMVRLSAQSPDRPRCAGRRTREGHPGSPGKMGTVSRTL